MDEATEVPVDKLATIFVKIREKKRELVAAHEAAVESLDSQMNVILAAIKDRMLRDNCQSMKLSAGTAYITRKTKYYASDWDGLRDWMVKNNALDLVEKRVSQSAMSKWFEENSNNPPTGVFADPEVTVVIRKS